MSRLLVIGCGGVAQVAISKICQDSETFKEIMIPKASAENKSSICCIKTY